MSNSGKFVHRDFPPSFWHPKFRHQPSSAEFAALAGLQLLEEYRPICPGHVLTKVHYDGKPARKRFIVEVALEQGPFFIETLCTYTPALGIDALDGNLIRDAEEWILVRELKLKPRRLKLIFGAQEKLSCEDYLRFISNPHAGRRFQDIPIEFDVPKASIGAGSAGSTGAPPERRKRWWQFW